MPPWPSSFSRRNRSLSVAPTPITGSPASIENEGGRKRWAVLHRHRLAGPRWPAGYNRMRQAAGGSDRRPLDETTGEIESGSDDAQLIIMALVCEWIEVSDA